MARSPWSPVRRTESARQPPSPGCRGRDRGGQPAADGRPDGHPPEDQGRRRRRLRGRRRHARPGPGRGDGRRDGPPRWPARLRGLERRDQPVHEMGRDHDRGLEQPERDQPAGHLGSDHRGRQADGQGRPRRGDRVHQLDLGPRGLAVPVGLLRHEGRHLDVGQGLRGGRRQARDPGQCRRARLDRDQHVDPDVRRSARREVLRGADRPRSGRTARGDGRGNRFPASDDASYVTSATLLVDAGFIVNAEL